MLEKQEMIGKRIVKGNWFLLPRRTRDPRGKKGASLVEKVGELKVKNDERGGGFLRPY